jgi:hypothetical protein
MALLLVMACLVTAVPAMADTLLVGKITLTSGFNVNGVDGNEFVLSNLTGDCNLIGVCTAVDFNDVELNLPFPFLSSINVGTVSADTTLFDSALFFPADQLFDGVGVGGTASVKTILLSNGNTFQSDSGNLFAVFPFPAPGASAGIIMFGTESSAVPEPSSAVLAISGLALLWAGRGRLRFRRQI